MFFTSQNKITAPEVVLYPANHLVSLRQRFKSDTQMQLYLLTLFKNSSRSLSYQG